jgi:hypothetical protein
MCPISLYVPTSRVNVTFILLYYCFIQKMNQDNLTVREEDKGRPILIMETYIININ